MVSPGKPSTNGGFSTSIVSLQEGSHGKKPHKSEYTTLTGIKSDSMTNHYADTMGYVTANMSLGNNPIPVISNNHRLKGSENE